MIYDFTKIPDAPHASQAAEVARKAGFRYAYHNDIILDLGATSLEREWVTNWKTYAIFIPPYFANQIPVFPFIDEASKFGSDWLQSVIYIPGTNGKKHSKMPLQVGKKGMFIKEIVSY